MLKLLYTLFSIEISYALKSFNPLTTVSWTSLNAKSISSTNLDWSNLGFEYRQTDSFAQCSYRNGAWGPVELIRGETHIKIHIGATSLHYGQACFEGLKVILIIIFFISISNIV
jgi:hypothetical protein